MNWQKANLGVAIGKTKHMQNPVLIASLNEMHMATSYQMDNDWFFRNFDERRCDLPMKQLFDNSREVWKR